MRGLLSLCLVVWLAGGATAQEPIHSIVASRAQVNAPNVTHHGPAGWTVGICRMSDVKNGECPTTIVLTAGKDRLFLGGVEYDAKNCTPGMDPHNEILGWFAMNEPVGVVQGAGATDIVPLDKAKWAQFYRERGGAEKFVAQQYQNPSLADCRKLWAKTLKGAERTPEAWELPITPPPAICGVTAGDCPCGPGCRCPAGACASGACGAQPIGTQAAKSGTVLVEQTISDGNGGTYTRVVEKPAGYVPMSGVRQSQQPGPLASGTGPRPHAAGTDDHTHTCPRCGTTWGGRGHSHSCPRCGTPQYVQDQPGYSATPYYPGRPGYAAQGGVTYPQPVYQPQQYRPVYSFGGGGCANGACGMPAQFSPWR